MTTPEPPADRFRKGFVLLGVAAISVLFFALIGNFIIPLFLAAIFSAMLYPVYQRIQVLTRGRAGVASLLTVVAAFIVVVIPVIGFLGLVATEALHIGELARTWVSQQVDTGGDKQFRLPEWLPFVDRLRPYRAELMSKLGEVASVVSKFLVQSLSRATQGALEFFLDLFVMLYAMFFFLVSGRQVLRKLGYYLPLAVEDKQRLLDKGLSVSRATLKGTFVIGALQGALAGGAFAVVGIEGSAFWGTIMAVLSVIPGIGSALVWVPAVGYLLAVGDVAAGIGLAVWCIAAVGSVDNLLRPRLVGGDTQMPDLLILVSTLGGLAMFGAVGIILGPVIAALFTTAWDIYGVAFAGMLAKDRSEHPEN